MDKLDQPVSRHVRAAGVGSARHPHEDAQVDRLGVLSTSEPFVDQITRQRGAPLIVKQRQIGEPGPVIAVAVLAAESEVEVVCAVRDTGDGETFVIPDVGRKFPRTIGPSKNSNRV